MWDWLLTFLFFFFSGLTFEKAYCEYRLNRTDEALRTLRGIAEPTLKEKELLAQVVSGIGIDWEKEIFKTEKAGDKFVTHCLIVGYNLISILSHQHLALILKEKELLTQVVSGTWRGSLGNGDRLKESVQELVINLLDPV